MTSICVTLVAIQHYCNYLGKSGGEENSKKHKETINLFDLYYQRGINDLLLAFDLSFCPLIM